MMSPAAYQPKPDVTDLEMAGGGMLLDEPSTERKVCAALGAGAGGGVMLLLPSPVQRSGLASCYLLSAVLLRIPT